MSDKIAISNLTHAGTSFFDQPNVELETLPIGKGIPFGIKQVINTDVRIGGVYGAWGESYDNDSLFYWIENHIGRPLADDEKMKLETLGFISRHHAPDLSSANHLELELQVGERLLRQAAQANDWEPSEIDGVLIGSTGPVSEDYLEQISDRAGIPQQAIKVSVHKACDSSMGALNLALNPYTYSDRQLGTNIAEQLAGKKVLVGGIEGLSRNLSISFDTNGLQLFGNGAGVIGVVPGETMHFLVGKDHEYYDEQGVLAVRMRYPYADQRESGKPLVEVTKISDSHVRVAGLMHAPEDGSPLSMAGPMGMVKLFVRTGVEVVKDVYQTYQALMDKLNLPEKSIRVAIVHHANYKINQLKAKHLQKAGINLRMPWLLSEFGNVSAASNMIAFLKQLPDLKPGDHILFDGFGAGTYYDVLAVSLVDDTI